MDLYRERPTTFRFREASWTVSLLDPRLKMRNLTMVQAVPLIILQNMHAAIVSAISTLCRWKGVNVLLYQETELYAKDTCGYHA